MNEFSIKIDRDIPLPGKSKYLKIPLTQLAIGDSMAIPIAYRQHVSMMASQAKRRTGRVYISRKLPDDINNFRIWRVK